MTRAADLAKLIAGGGTITVADNSDTLTLESTDADANVGPVLNLHRNSASPADGDLTGRIVFKADDDAGNAATFARIEATAVDVSNGGEDGRLDFFTAKDDAFNAAVSILGTDVGIGTTSPTDTGGFGKALDVSSSTGAAVYVRDSGGSKTGHFGQFNEQTSVVSRQDDGNIAFYVGASPEESTRIDSSGNLLVGKTSVSGSGTGHVLRKLDSAIFTRNSSNSLSETVQISRHASDGLAIRLNTDATQRAGIGVLSDEGMYFTTGASSTERMRINNDGSLFINHASQTHPIVGTERLGVIGGTGSTAVAIACNAGHATGVGLFVSSTPDGAVDFVKFSSGSGGDTRGLIEFDGSNVTYGGTSDYRLKENVATYTKGIETLKKLNPIAFTWKESKASDVGFLAHEVAEIHPSAVSGDKDGMETVAGEEKIRPQMLDPSKLVGILTAALQEAIVKIETLEAEVAKLKG